MQLIISLALQSLGGLLIQIRIYLTYILEVGIDHFLLRILVTRTLAILKRIGQLLRCFLNKLVVEFILLGDD